MGPNQFTNPIFQRHDFQNRRSASEPAHELQAGNRLTNAVSTEQPPNNPNNFNESNHQHGDGCNYVDCLQKTAEVRFFSTHKTAHTLPNITIHKTRSR